MKTSYLKNDLIDINAVKFTLNNNYKNKSIDKIANQIIIIILKLIEICCYIVRFNILFLLYYFNGKIKFSIK